MIDLESDCLDRFADGGKGTDRGSIPNGRSEPQLAVGVAIRSGSEPSRTIRSHVTQF
jgi:hypothetical protein